MDELGYNLLVDRSVKRKARILSFLLESESPIPLEVLATKLNVSLKTINTDATLIIELSLGATQLVSINGVLCIEKIQDNTLITELFHSIIQNNPLFFIIESIFNGESKDIFFYAEKLFLSEYTVKKYLNILKDVISQYGLTLSNSPLEILGPEIQIRYFYFQYFRYAHSSSTPILNDTQYNFIYNTIQSLLNDYDLVLNVDYYRVAHWLFIFEKRLEQKHFIQIPDSIRHKYEKKTSYLKFKHAMLTHFSSNPLFPNLTESELLFCYLCRLDTVIYEENKVFFTDDFYREQKKFEELIVSFFESFNISLSKNSSLISMTQAYLVNVSILTDLSCIFQKNPEKLKRKAERSFPETVKLWEKLLFEHTNFRYHHDIAVNLALLTHTATAKKKNILFALTGEPISVNYYKELALKCAPYDMHTIFLFNAPLDNKLIEKMNIDICVHNFIPPEKLLNVQIFRLSDIPLDIEWKNLAQLLYSI